MFKCYGQFSPELDKETIDNDKSPLFPKSATKKPIHFSHRMPDPYLRPAIKKIQAPTGQNKLILERDRIQQFRQKHPKVVFKKQDFCYKMCKAGSSLRYNEHCRHSAGIYTYADENYVACLFFENEGI